MDYLRRFNDSEKHVLKFEQTVIVYFERYEDIVEAFQPYVSELSSGDHQLVHGLCKTFRKQVCEALDILEQRTGKGIMAKIALEDKVKLAFRDDARLDTLFNDLQAQLELLEDCLKHHNHAGQQMRPCGNNQTAQQQWASTSVHCSSLSNSDFLAALESTRLRTIVEELLDTTHAAVDSFGSSHSVTYPLTQILFDLSNQRRSMIDMRTKLTSYWSDVTWEDYQSINEATWGFINELSRLKALVKARTHPFKLRKQGPVTDEQVQEASIACTAQFQIMKELFDDAYVTLHSKSRQ